MAKLTKRTVAAVSKGKKEIVAKPKTGPKTTPKVADKVATKPAVKTPVKHPRTPRKAIDTTIPPKPVEPVETPKVHMAQMIERRKTPLKEITVKPTFVQLDEKVENKPKKQRKLRSFVTDTSKFRKYNNELRVNLRNLIYDKNYTMAKIARKIGVVPSYLFNILRVKDEQGNGRSNVVPLDIAYAICNAIGAHIISVLPEADTVNPVYKSKSDYVEKLEKLEEENKQLNFLYTQTKKQLENKNANYRKVELKFRKLERIKVRLTALVESIEELEESKS